MIQIRDPLQVKFGKVDQAVELLNGSYLYAPFSEPDYHLAMLTDVTGLMYTLITEFVVPNLSAFEAARDETMKQPGHEDWFRKFQLFVGGGKREYYNVEGASAAWTRPGLMVVREAYRTYKWQTETTLSLLKREGP